MVHIIHPEYDLFSMRIKTEESENEIKVEILLCKIAEIGPMGVQEKEI